MSACGCRVEEEISERTGWLRGHEIVYCALHTSAERLVAALAECIEIAEGYEGYYDSEFRCVGDTPSEDRPKYEAWRRLLAEISAHV